MVKNQLKEAGLVSKTVERVKEIADPIAQEMGYQLAKVEYLKEGKHWFLRLYIDQVQGITLDDCVAFSERVGEALDSVEPDPIPQAYFLEVSSLGAERPLESDEDFKQSIGKYIQVTLHQAVEGHSIYQGDLLDVDEDSIRLAIRVKAATKEISIDKDLIAQAQLTVKL